MKRLLLSALLLSASSPAAFACSGVGCMQSYAGTALANDAVLHGSIPVYFIFYGEWKVDTTGVGGLIQDPQIGILEAFAESIGNTSWISPVTGYYDNSGNASTNLIYRGAVFDGTGNQPTYQGSRGNSLTTYDVISILQRALTTNADFSVGSNNTMLATNANAIYVIVLHSDVTYIWSGNGKIGPPQAGYNQICGFHEDSQYFNTTSANYQQAQHLINGVDVKFVVLGDPASNPTTCERMFANGSGGYVPTPNGNLSGDSMAYVLGHEFAESITDPVSYSTPAGLVGGWRDESSAHQEIADLCENSTTNVQYTNGAPYNVSVGSSKWLVQSLWKNLGANGGVCAY